MGTGVLPPHPNPPSSSVVPFNFQLSKIGVDFSPAHCPLGLVVQSGKILFPFRSRRACLCIQEPARLPSLFLLLFLLLRPTLLFSSHSFPFAENYCYGTGCLHLQLDFEHHTLNSTPLTSSPFSSSISSHLLTVFSF